MLEIKDTIAKRKNAFAGPRSGVGTTEERTSAPEDMERETSQTEQQRKQGLKAQNGKSKNSDTQRSRNGNTRRREMGMTPQLSETLQA